MLNELKRNEQGKVRIGLLHGSLDSKINSDPLVTKHNFKDGRQEKVFLTSAADKWAGKQNF